MCRGSLALAHTLADANFGEKIRSDASGGRCSGRGAEGAGEQGERAVIVWTQRRGQDRWAEPLCAAPAPRILHTVSPYNLALA